MSAVNPLGGGGSSSNSAGALRQQAGTWWRARTPRERQAVLLVIAVLVLFILWSLAVAPALRTLREAPAQLDRLDAQTQQLQRAATEVNGLRSATRVSTAQATAALKAATDRLGANAKLNLQGDRGTLVISGTGVTGEALRGWLNEARSGARARPTDAQLQRTAAGYTGSLGVVLGGGS